MKTYIYLSTGEVITTTTDYEDIKVDIMSMKFVAVNTTLYKSGGGTEVTILLNVNHIVKVTQ